MSWGRRLAPMRRLDEHLVAGIVSERVVDALEPVEIAEQHGERAGAARQVDNRLAEAVHEQGAVGQPGERVVQRLERQRLLGGGLARVLRPSPLSARQAPGSAGPPRRTGLDGWRTRSAPPYRA